MVEIFGLNIPDIVNDAIGEAGGLVTLTLRSHAEGTRTPGSPSAGKNPTFAPHAGQGILDEYHEREVDGSLIEKGDRKVLILGASLPDGVIPKAKDRIEIEDFTEANSAALRVVKVKRDPAAATYVCQVRG